jgi:hypothetical protein
MTATLATTWHRDFDINDQPYPVRTHVPDLNTDFPTLDLPPRETLYLSAIHEAGHAVVLLARGGHVHYTELRHGTFEHGAYDGRVDVCSIGSGNNAAAFFGAGERAMDRRLRETGLWTPYRGMVAEVGAYADRQEFLTSQPDLGFGDKPIDYRTVHDMADAALDTHWSAVLRVAEALAQHHYLDGAAIADLSGLPNGQRHACTTT